MNYNCSNLPKIYSIMNVQQTELPALPQYQKPLRFLTREVQAMGIVLTKVLSHLRLATLQALLDLKHQVLMVGRPSTKRLLSLFHLTLPFIVQEVPPRQINGQQVKFKVHPINQSARSPLLKSEDTSTMRRTIVDGNYRFLTLLNMQILFLATNQRYVKK
jgi:hypothetical protein